MVKVLFALAKYLTWWFIKPHVSRCCVANLTHILQTLNACSSCFKQYFPFLPEGENMHNFIIKSIASTHYFIKSIASSRCVEDTPGYTLVHTLVYDKHSPACWVSRKLRPKSKTILCYTADCFKSSCLQFVDTMSKVNVSGSATWLPICIAKTFTPQTLRWLNSLAQMTLASSSVINLVYSYKANQTWFECSLLF